MGYNARNDEIRDNVTRMRREWEAQRGGWLRCGASTQRFPRRATCGSGPRLPPHSRQSATGSLSTATVAPSRPSFAQLARSTIHLAGCIWWSFERRRNTDLLRHRERLRFELAAHQSHPAEEDDADDQEVGQNWHSHRDVSRPKCDSKYGWAWPHNLCCKSHL